ncbi:hypothetical protein GLGCALEP_03972 [Pseudomonas sp. MM221]|nr:hypothetical protein GLGCALEP_03972 [Pseudomonas sp. MM221]
MEGHGLWRFGGAVEVHIDGIGRNGADLLVQRRAERIAAPEQEPQPIKHLAIQVCAGFDQLAQWRGEVDHAHAVLVNPACQP